MGKTISFSLILGSTFYFNMGGNLLHLYPLSNAVPCNLHTMRIVKKTTHVIYWITGDAHQRNSHRKCTQWSTKYTCREQGWASCINKVWTVWIIFLKLLRIENPYNKTPYDFTADCALKHKATFSERKEKLNHYWKSRKAHSKWIFLNQHKHKLCMPFIVVRTMQWSR